MGQEINKQHFTEDDYTVFETRLREETALLAEMLASGKFDHPAYITGFELEAWLLDSKHCPAPLNMAFLERMANPLVVPELSRFNVELNGTPQALQQRALSNLEAELNLTWQRCQQMAQTLQSSLLMIGTLPTLRNEDLCLANISPLKRYAALNEGVLKARKGRPIRLDIAGRERLVLTHDDVMLEAATTSFQVHLQTPIQQFQRHFNASLIMSAPMVAIAANSPFLFETSLWDETRIPLFEQAVDIGDLAHPELQRVSFGSGYLQTSPDACFHENLSHFPVLLPMCFESKAHELQHLRLHNGTVWRWNRPLIGFDDRNNPHLRIEHRVMPAGPSIADMIANTALYLGATHCLASQNNPPEEELTFETARNNFYQTAQFGLNASIRWIDGREHSVRNLLLDELIPLAEAGLTHLGIARDDRKRYLQILRLRADSGLNGAIWQRAYIDAHGKDFIRLTAAYQKQQLTGRPVHEWDI